MKKKENKEMNRKSVFDKHKFYALMLHETKKKLVVC